MALRLTSEWNRRLFAGVHRFRFFGKKQRIRTSNENHNPININPPRSWIPPIEEESSEDIFHAKNPRKSSSADELRRGVARWGPDLLPYLEPVFKLLGISSNGVEIPLTMIYLDRACSVETLRSNGCPPCPFCMPRTVHRLSVISLFLTTQAVDGNRSINEYYQDLESLGIPQNQLEQMVDWMRAALGDDGLYVTVGQKMRIWSQTWNAKHVYLYFFPQKRQQAQALQQQAQLAASNSSSKLKRAFMTGSFQSPATISAAM